MKFGSKALFAIMLTVSGLWLVTGDARLAALMFILTELRDLTRYKDGDERNSFRKLRP